jgi:hypothetical protein
VSLCPCLAPATAAGVDLFGLLTTDINRGYKFFSARALQSNSAALWLYERMCASKVVGLVVRRGHVREAREAGRRGRARVAARGLKELRLWEPQAGDNTSDAPLGGDRDGAHPGRPVRAPGPPVRRTRSDERIDERLSASTSASAGGSRRPPISIQNKATTTTTAHSGGLHD